MTLNERESFLAFHYEQYLKENPNIDLVNAKYIYEYAHKNPLVEHLRESHFIVWQAAKAQAVPKWIGVEVGVPVYFGTRVKIKRKSWDEKDNLIFVESEATYDKDSDFCELSHRTYEYVTWFDHQLNKYLEEDELTHWAPLDKSESGVEE